MTTYDPEQYWDSKVDKSPGDPGAAVRIGDPLLDECIARTQRHLLQTALNELEKHASLDELAALDFGCGTGQWATLLSACCRSYYGADISQRMLDAAAKSYPQFGFHKVVDNKLPFKDEAFDLVSSIAVLHHNDYAEQDRLMGELRRVLKPNSWLIAFEGIGERNLDSTKHHYYRPIDEWRQFFIDQGFEVYWHRVTRYALLWYLCERVEDKIGFAGLKGKWPYDAIRGLGRRGVLALDRVFGPALVRLTPDRIAGRQMMLLRYSSPS